MTQEKLKEIVDYNEDNGVFYWKKSTGSRAKIGCKVGSITQSGYVEMMILGKRYLAHRLVWLYKFGEIPKKHIDHINQNKTDNRITNLREVTSAENNRNAVRSKSNTPGVNGVCYDKQNKKWVASITVDYKYINLGRFKIKEEAMIARLQANIKYGFTENHGGEKYEAT